MMETERTVIRRLLISDFEELRILLSDNEVMKHTGFKGTLSEDKTRDLLDAWVLDQGVWAVISKSDNHLIGWFMLKMTSHKYPELGFMLKREAWGKGFATEVSKKLITYAKDTLKLEKIMASTHVSNVSSQNVLQKIGMKGSENYYCKDEILHFEMAL